MISTLQPDPLYVAARMVLLDALDALVDHRDAIVIVGAQAVYLRTSDADLDATLSPMTTDADLALNPGSLGPSPQLAEAMRAAGFALKVKGTGGVEPGSWLATVKVEAELRRIPVDLIVPGALATGHGRRDARLPDHGRLAARWADGLEAAVVDNTELTVRSLDPDTDPRVARVRVAGVSALLVAKCYKLHERLQNSTGRPHRIRSKDAADVIRLMRGPMEPSAVGIRLRELSTDPMAGASVRTGVEFLLALFGHEAAPGIGLAAAALVGALDEDETRHLATTFVHETVSAFG